MTTILAGLGLLAALVVVHEFGHFVVAKIFGIGVPVFSVGMGPRLWGFKWRGTDYRISALPIGGYVRLAGADPFGEEDPDDELVEPDDEFMSRPVWQRLLVMLAGPAFNLALPFVVFTAVLMLGEPQDHPTVGLVLDDSPAAEADIRYGDVFLEVDGEPIDIWIEVIDAFTVAGEEERPLEVLLDRGGERVQRTLPTPPLRDNGYADMTHVGIRSYRLSGRIGVDDPTSPAARAGLTSGDMIVAVNDTPVEDLEQLKAQLVGVGPFDLELEREEGNEVIRMVADPAWSSELPQDYERDRFGLVRGDLFVGDVVPDTPAEAFGVQSGDRILAVDGKPVETWVDLVDLVGETAAEHVEGADPRALTLSLLRDGAVVDLAFAPRMEREIVAAEVRWRPVMGIRPYTERYVGPPQTRKYYGFLEAVPRAVEETTYLFTQTMKVLGQLLTGGLKAKESLGGPIEMFRMAGEGVSAGMFTYVRMIGTISISLGIINLLPVPVLDGGQIVIYLLEAVRGRPLPLSVREKMQMVGVLALVALMLYVAVNDVNRWITGG